MPAEVLIVILRPYLAYAFTLVADLLIAHGWLLKEGASQFVNDGITIASAGTALISGIIVVWYEYKHRHNSTVSTTEITTKTETPMIEASEPAGTSERG